MNLQEIKEREARATPGFWVNMGEHNPDSVFFGEIRCGGTQEQETFILIAVMPESDDRTDDFNFIAHAREDIPALVAEVERLQAENERMRTVLKAYYAFSVDPNYAVWPEKNFTDRLNAITEAADAALKGKDYEIPAELRSNHL
jgi:hypothetical protein